VRKLLARIQGNTWVAALVVLATYTLSLVSTLSVREWNSDDVGMQLMVRTWRPFRSIAHVSDDTFILKYPFYVLVNSVRPLDRLSVALLSALFHALGVVVIVLALRKAGHARASDVGERMVGEQTAGAREIAEMWVRFAGLFWFASLGSRYFWHEAGPNLRNVESFLALLLLCYCWCTPSSKVSVAVFAVGWSLLFLDDPFFAFAFAIPLAVFAGLATVRPGVDRLRFGSLSISVGIGAVLWQVYKVVLHAAGLRIVAQRVELVKRRDLPLSFRNTKTLFLSFGGASSTSGPSAQVLLNRVALAGLFVFLVLAFATGPNLVRLVCVAAVLPPAAFIVSGRATTFATGRYLLFSFPVLAVVFYLAPGRWHVKSLLAVALTAAAVLNTGQQLPVKRAVPPDEIRHEKLARELTKRSLTYGYAGFWDSHIVSYFSHVKTTVLPVECVGGSTRIYHWLMDDRVIARPTDRSFSIVDPTGGAGSCNEADAVKQFGPSSDRFEVDGRVVLIWNADVRSKLG
jgi:hypothetical protein